ncbi:MULTISPECIES: dihydroxyacetone kinase phosphoryl donor subunit DhaM [Actinoalloteichus]|uniref:Phosphocarrier protein HPr n=1 Tax=Actinoalloteichus fjordicus TaxID=1612552 RepID=A0AAC9LB86_9PSEU|nr:MULTISPECIES: dihydroxyacetone kinase phosphoryl donor subunit DhaM [Actinoalloteichus]APU13502.1 phosphotransferase system HPr (HPr) family protein [Actinoalloteichus fjordicus]APU19451.1 phosphotransferase system HPr (HPr) family protein [Actinoalloteichus sp. GBA129-24]
MTLVGLVLVSHSRQLAAGLAELAGQMAPDVRIEAAGGLPGGELGSDLELVSAAVDRAEQGRGVVLLYDIGSAQMTAELAVEALDDPGRAYVADAPFVEGAVAAAVAAQGGADLESVALTASSAAADAEWPLADPGFGAADPAVATTAVATTGVAETTAVPAGDEALAHAAGSSPGSAESALALGSDSVLASETPGGEIEVELRNDVGLHARPAALLARRVAGLDARVTVQYGERLADAASVLALMGLGAGGGSTVRVLAVGPDAAEALRRVADLAARRFEG